MKLQMKLLLSLAAILLLISISIPYTLYLQKKSLDQIQSARSQEFIKIFHEITDLKLSKIDAFLYDCTYWSEMVDYVTSRDAEWSLINITEPMKVFKIDYAYVIDPSNRSVYYHQQNPNFPNLEKTFHTMQFDFEKPRFSRFFVMTDAGPVQLFVAPIQPSEDVRRITKPQGYMIVGKIWDAPFIRFFSNITGHTIVLDSDPSHVYDADYPLKGADGRMLTRIGINLSHTTTDILYSLFKMQTTALVIISLLGMLIFGIFIFKLVILPMRRISGVMETSDRIQLQPLFGKNDEFSSIARLIDQFFIQKNDLAHNNLILEQKVEERTRELEEINRTLDERVRREIMQRREQEQILIQQSRFAAMGEMIGNIAHQWRQPLNALSLLLQNILFSYTAGRLDETMMQRVNDKGNLLITSMSNTIDDFRNFFKPNRDKEVFNIAYQLEKILEMARSSFEANLITVDKTVDASLYTDGFPNEFSQVILNLLNNAKDALIEHRPHQRLIRINGYRTGPNIHLEVCDNAGGIDPAVIDKIFDPYFTTKDEGKGTGIGLYMSKVIIENNMQGKLYARNNDDGAVFTVVLPIPEETR